KKPLRMMKRTESPRPSIVSDLLDAGFAEQPRRLEQEDENQHDEDENVGPSRIVAQLDELADDADETPAEQRARDAPDAAQYRGDERASSDHHAHRGIHLRLIEAVQHCAQRS